MKDEGEIGDEGSVDFDSWVAGRSGALTRFAYVLTGSEVAAEQALSSALTIACATWSRVRRSDDPEAHVRRLVVGAHLSTGGLLRRRRPTPVVVPAPSPSAAAFAAENGDDATQAWRLCATLPPPQRAAVVLRCFAEMTYPQIATSMGGKENTAREYVEQSFAALALAIGRSRTDVELESAFREGFAEHADDWLDTGDRAVLAHAGARRRRRRLILPAAAVAMLLVGGLAVAAISYDRTDATALTEPGAHPQGWRAESYNGIQLWVPPSWAWGEVPGRSSNGLLSCGFGAYSPTAAITNLRYVLQRGGPAPYVGRPVGPGLDCTLPVSSTAPHVWFDSPLPVGSGPRQTTVSVTGLSIFNVTVADTNPTERQAILASVERFTVDAHGCPRDAAGTRAIELLSLPEPSPGSVRTMSLCLFVGGPGRERLFYSTELEGPAARKATAALEHGPRPSLTMVCSSTPALSQTVLVTRSATRPSVFVVDPGTCRQGPVGYVTGAGHHALTEESLRLWALDGLALYPSPDLQEPRLSPVLPPR